MGRGHYPDLAGQHGTKMLQSVEVTSGTGKTHLAIGLGIKAAQAGHRVLFATATEWVTRLQAAHSAGGLTDELARLRRYGLLIVDEVGYIPFEQDAANLFFQLVSSRYEHASLILTSNLPFARWGDVFGDQVVAAAMIDRIVHHAEVITLKGSSHRLRNTGIDTLPSARAENTHTRTCSLFERRKCSVFERHRQRGGFANPEVRAAVVVQVAQLAAGIKLEEGQQERPACATTSTVATRRPPRRADHPRLAAIQPDGHHAPCPGPRYGISA
jgi:hypothetical protein